MKQISKKLFRPCSECGRNIIRKTYAKQLIDHGELRVKPPRVLCGICLRFERDNPQKA